MKTRILLLGGDGYIGWPLALRLGVLFPKASLTIVDNFTRRRLVKLAGGCSVLPILDLEERIDVARAAFGWAGIEAVDLDVTGPALDALVRETRPTHIYHLAQMGSAPWSMRDAEAGLFTLHNNEAGNLRLLWAVKRFCPEAHIIKLGSLGEYAQCGLDIPDGYFLPAASGKTATVSAPFPRAADDIYHITKINDSNFIGMACRKWGLAVTDVMQATVVGAGTEETAAVPALCTRFDCDAYFGTVLNRFIVQALLGRPLTVFGSGHQRTGLMALPDTVNSLAAMIEAEPEYGRHRVINHVTEKKYSINELAEAVREIGSRHSLDIGIDYGSFDPRTEQLPAKQDYEIEAQYLSKRLYRTPLETVVTGALEALAPYRDRVRQAAINPAYCW